MILIESSRYCDRTATRISPAGQPYGPDPRVSAGQPVELADLPVEDPGGSDAAQRADPSGQWARGVAQLRLRIGGGCDDHLGDGGGVVALVHRRGHHVVEDAPL